MRILTITFIAYLLLVPASGFTAETTDFTSSQISSKDKSQAVTAPATISEAKPAKPEEPVAEKEPASKKPATDLSITEQIKQEKPKARKKRTPPSEIPPDTSFTTEQVKAFSRPREENYIILNFDNAALRDVINTISSITGESFILSPGLDARITIYSPGKIPTREALNVFESILEVNNMALVKSEHFYKIVPGATTKQKPIEIQVGREPSAVPSKDRPITQIVQVEYVPAIEISSVLQPMLSQFGSIIPNPRNNLLIINDVASNIKRLLSILKEIDVDAFKNTRMGFFQPKFSDVKSLSQEVKDILNSLNLGQHGIAIIPIERINSLIVFSSSPSLLRIIEGWLKKLDEEVATGQNIFVYPLQNVKAESIVNVLKTIYETEDTVKPRSTASRKAPSPGAKAPRRPARRPPVGLEGSTAFSRVEIVTFEPTNSLVILAPPGIYRDIVETIKQLDIYPQEVLIEALIAEVTITDSDKFGIQWSVLHSVHIEGDPDFTGLAQSRSSDAPSYTLPLTLGSGSTSTSLTAGGLSYLLFKPDRLAALIHAIASKGKVNILSSPRLLVRDQEEASIEVGSDIPTATSTTSTTTTDTLTQNIEYRTVGVKLKIKPTINDEKTVVLDIEQEVSAKGTDQQVGQTGNLFPSFTTTKTKTSIIVQDKQGIIIGGLMEELKDKNYQGIPILSSIPILGHLFRYTTNSITKKELIIIITPHVISNRTEADVITIKFLEKLKEIKDFLNQEEAQVNIPAPEETNKAKTNEQ